MAHNVRPPEREAGDLDHLSGPQGDISRPWTFFAELAHFSMSSTSLSFFVVESRRQVWDEWSPSLLCCDILPKKGVVEA